MKSLVILGYGSVHFSSTKSYLEFAAGYIGLVLLGTIIVVWFIIKWNKTK